MSKQHSFWEDAYDQCMALAQSVDALTALLEQNEQGELAHHIYSLFVTIPQSVAMRTPPAIRERIAKRLDEEFQAKLKAALDTLVAELPEGTDSLSDAPVEA